MRSKPLMEMTMYSRFANPSPLWSIPTLPTARGVVFILKLYAGLPTLSTWYYEEMGTVTYKKQPGIHQTRGAVPLAGTKHLYTVKSVLWPEDVTGTISSLLIPRSLHVCCGHSPLGDVRVDFDPEVKPDIVVDAAKLPFDDASFETVLCDPPYNGVFQWN